MALRALADRELSQIVVVANKIDLASQRVIPSSGGVEYAQSIVCNHFDVSAKTGEGMDEWYNWIREQVKEWKEADK